MLLHEEINYQDKSNEEEYVVKYNICIDDDYWNDDINAVNN